ncbi:LysR family transcriptional regulator [Pseudooceanicola sp. 502str34]|uniref:LysR family transcriptional regulator n=1 Tax=Maritimibacter alkaliphilus TaxID=404236 RepID=UPI001C953B51|nr:LysR family transcriptional regulator [Maritimibacter alkaliphilus]MBY6091139.1 LysR family transcriptional regulator [Maritimibacter alkaliphilus]
MQLGLLETFRSVIETGSTQAAAAHLGITQSAVSRRISQLEQELGLDLFLRDRGRLVPTKECRLLQGQIFGLVDRGAQLATVARELKQGNSAAITLRVAVPGSLTLSIMPGILRDFLAENDLVQVELHTGPYDTIERMLLDERAEVGFLRIPIQRPGLTVTPVIRARTVCVMPDDHPLTAKSEITVNDLRGEPLILLGRMRAPRREIDETFWTAGLKPQVRVEAHSVMSACSLVAAGLGVTLVNELMAHDYDHLPITHRPMSPALSHNFAFAMSAETPLSQAAQAFVDLSSARLQALLRP